MSIVHKVIMSIMCDSIPLDIHSSSAFKIQLALKEMALD